MIKEEYVSFEVALLLKEKGFEQFGCQKQYNTSGDLCEGFCYGPVAPTQQMAMRWLREIHNRMICISMGHEEKEGNHDHCNPDKWYYIFEVVNEKGVYREEEQPDPFTNEYATYEEAVEAALKYCLENLIQKSK